MKMTKAKETPLHVLVNNPVDVRRHVLLAGVDGIKCLERYEHFKKLKSVKKKKFLELSEKLKHINLDIHHLITVLPELKEKKVEKDMKRYDYKEELVPKTQKKDKLTDLHREMRDIHEKLSRLNF